MWLLTGTVALGVHTRTLLAPFIAIHGDLRGTLAALESWRLSARFFGLCLSTFILASLPAALPLALLGLVGALALPPPALADVSLAIPDLAWAGIQAVRPVLIPALYRLYCDLWGAELGRRRHEGEPPIPAFVRALLTITRPLPRLGRLKQ